MSFTQASTYHQTETSHWAGAQQLPTVTSRWATSTTAGPAPAGSSTGRGPPGPPDCDPLDQGPPGPSPPDCDQGPPNDGPDRDGPPNDPPGDNPSNPGNPPPDHDPDDDGDHGPPEDDNPPWDTQVDLANAILALAYQVAHPHTQHSKVREPDQFDGSNSQKLQSFLMQCQLNFNDWVSTFASDKSKVNYVLSLLKGMALDWFEPNLLRIQEGGDPPPWIDDYPSFISELCTNFRPHNPIGDAEADIETLHMCDTQCITKYVIKFNQLASQLEWGPAAPCHQFYKGLLAWIKDNITQVGKPKTFIEMRTLSQSIDARYWEHWSKVSCQSLSHQKSEASSSKTNTN